ncbi:MAG: hypothetical protein LBQ52_00175 [Helicobacteraceae bacterium]|jgi:hypothetical protein|nr:hypothetical protein [Helicobacteraceae bacterium]
MQYGGYCTSEYRANDFRLKSLSDAVKFVAKADEYAVCNAIYLPKSEKIPDEYKTLCAEIKAINSDPQKQIDRYYPFVFMFIAGSPKVSAEYDADSEQYEIKIGYQSNAINFETTQLVPVPYANRDLYRPWLDKALNNPVSVEVSLIADKVAKARIAAFDDPNWAAIMVLNDAGNSKTKLTSLVKDFPNAKAQIAEANKRLTSIAEQEKAQAAEAAKNEAQRKIEQEEEARLNATLLAKQKEFYAAKKSFADIVCVDKISDGEALLIAMGKVVMVKENTNEIEVFWRDASSDWKKGVKGGTSTLSQNEVRLCKDKL